MRAVFALNVLSTLIRISLHLHYRNRKREVDGWENLRRPLDFGELEDDQVRQNYWNGPSGEFKVYRQIVPYQKPPLLTENIRN